MDKILTQYGFEEKDCEVRSYGTGLINTTSLVLHNGKKYILQKVNNKVFKQPELIAHNIKVIESYLQQTGNEYYFVTPVKTLSGETLVHPDGNGYYRLFPFVEGSHTIDVVQTPDQAYEAAKQFGKFTKVLSGVDMENIRITLPFFHDLGLRYNQFLETLKTGNAQRIADAKKFIQKLNSYADIVREYEDIKHHPEFKLRVTHHDTKISNVLFDDADKGICVIDLDTVMPGYFISDVGDMMRTYLCPVSEEEKDFDKIRVRDDFYHAIVRGYNECMQDELTETEKKYFFYSGKFIIYMQALRFLTDHLNNDVYYGARYEGHNFIRAQNQVILLEKLLEKEEILTSAVALAGKNQ